MLKPVVDRLRYALNRVDRALGLNIYPRDRLFTASMRSLESLGTRSLVLDTGAHGFDMIYYAMPFTQARAQYLCFHATRLRPDGTSSSHLTIVDDHQKIVWSVNARELGFDHFASPQVIAGAQLELFFCARTGKRNACYSMDLTGFTTRKPRKLLDDAQEQAVFEHQGTRYLLYVRTGASTFSLVRFPKSGTLISTMQRPSDLSVTFKTRARYTYLSNPSVVVEGNSVHLFCRLSTKNALGSSIVSFTSKDLKTFAQTTFALRPRQTVERHATAFPAVTRDEKGWRIHYTGYWGAHLLERHTLKRWNAAV